ncbi:class II fumarate hydratase [Ignavigranum ruoffiae]|uniref:class II fumarate hydratase n=1 Tax=Ignavigranum ruoffiae TaxID=89093 RepID=UPI002063F260|nr:class II fumarate hydratase [Ignavigranum ruoffiae]UPQ85805.1 class II fumarate hydratase [Ignavigranum ruoffiae]
MEFRIEHDSLGEVKVPADKYWGAQTQRSFQNFKIGQDRMPLPLIYNFAVLKKAAALTNYQLGKLDQERCQLICQVCDEIQEGRLDEHFPLVVWQTGSGTQSNMNVNEVIANRGNEIAGQVLLHPNDHVNMSQSSNDTFPTAMHLVAVNLVEEQLLPAIADLSQTFQDLSQQYQHLIKVGRTHLQDATPITFGQEVSGWQASLDRDQRMIERSLQDVYEIALGGTAVGTGLNAPAGFAERVAEQIADLTGYPIRTAENKFHALSSKDELVFLHGALKALAADALKIANDIRWLASGPRCGLAEITIPANEPGSSIMPGKVNPTQSEALTMVAVQVMANDVAVGLAASQGNFELNVYMPVMIKNVIESIQLLADALNSFNKNCAQGIEANESVMAENLQASLMLVTRLNPVIGYEKAAQVAKKAYEESISLKEASVQLGYLSEEEYDQIIKPEEMI